jgi:hypothetical protein
MKRLLFASAFLLLLSPWLHSQLLTWTPAFPKDNDNITITLDASKGNQGLYNYGNPNNVYVHIGVTTNLSNNGGQQWLYVNGSTGGSWGSATPALKATSLGGNLYQYTINNIRSFFAVPAGETIKKIGILFRDANADPNLVKKAANTDNSDMYIPVYDNSLAVRFAVPPFQPRFIPIPEPINKLVGDNISITGVASQVADMKLYLNGTVINTLTGVTTISANPTLTTAGNNEIVVEATASAVTKKDTLRFFIVPSVTTAPLPAGVRDGINYAANNTEATLVLFAPGKTRISIIGEFTGSNWLEQSQYLMNKTPDGNYWWLKITGLTAGTEYAFQYLVDGTIKIGDPYSEKILDPSNDGSISASTYPALKPYPTGQTGIVSVLQTNAPAYSWAVNSFSRPDKKNLVIYELLLRDFIANHDWKTMRDTLNYLKTMGVNAIEVMPFNEFEGNESWGYNPDFFLAPDKYYGPKNSLKEFVDSCHKRGISVIMDIALNHTTGQNPLAALYWNSSTSQPAANNPWLNVSATHPYNVFNDFNHESLNTRYFTSRVIEYWLQEYKLDGFRWDLAKGFTQNTQCGGSTTNESCISDYHADRVAIWKRYYDTMQLKSAGTYCILEMFAANTEEIELSNYGMMLWGNNTYNFQQASRGIVDNTSNFEGFLHTARGWSNPHLVSYMESHDEERLMYRNLQEGNNSNATYNIRDLNVGLKRIELCAAFFLSAPGPKMIWEFGELGYDFSINRCTDGSINNNCRLDKKPIRWDYLQVAERKHLYEEFTNLNKLRFHPWYKDVFIANNINLTRNLSGAFKSMIIKSANDSSMLCVVGNFDVTTQSGLVTFPTAGTWFDYLNNITFTATGTPQAITLLPGEFHVYLNRNLNGITTPVININDPGDALQVIVYPNPLDNASVVEMFIPEKGNVQADLWNAQGQKVANVFSGTLTKGKHTVLLSGKTNNLPPGMYLLKVETKNKIQPVKVLIQ